MSAEQREEDGTQEPEFDVALSFAGEDRSYVASVAAVLQRAGVRVFYDEYEKVTLWGKDLYDHLGEVYGRRAQYTVVFISEHYARKVWTNHERRSAQARALEERREYILPARFDSTEIPGIHPTTGYIDLRTTTPEELADLIMRKLGRVPADSRQLVPPTPDRDAILALIVKVQSRRAPLAECVAEGLAFAQACHASDLVEFCTNELVGYSQLVPEAELAARSYRHMPMYCIPGALNMYALGFQGMSAFDYIDTHLDQFVEKTYIVRSQSP